jgi:amino acid transporter
MIIITITIIITIIIIIILIITIIIIILIILILITTTITYQHHVVLLRQSEHTLEKALHLPIPRLEHTANLARIPHLALQGGERGLPTGVAILAPE